MKSIVEYLNTNLHPIVFESYNQVYNNVEDCRAAMQDIHDMTPTLNDFIKFMYGHWDGEYSSIPFIFDPGQTRIKINSIYKFDEEVQSYLESIGVSGAQETFKVGNQTFKWGAGSFSRSAKSTSISTDIQEEISVIVFNKYYADHDKITAKDIDLTGTIGEEYMQYADWMTSWAEQFNTIKRQLKDWKDLAAVRYGNDSDAVSKALSVLHTKVCKQKGVSRKDTIDPTDIILYKKNAANKVVDMLKCDVADPFIEAKNNISQLYRDQLYVGVSLKKGKSFEPMKLNFEPVEGFENAHVVSIKFDPVRDFFGKDQKLIDSFRKGEFTSISWNEYHRMMPKMAKTCQFIIDCDDEKGIVLDVRTNQDGYRKALVCEPHLKNAKAMIGKCPATKWHAAIGKVNPTYAAFIDKMAKTVKYDVDDLCNKWQEIQSEVGCDATSEDIRKLFVMFEPLEQKAADSVLWSIYNQIHFLYGLLKGRDKDLVRKILLWSEKLDEDCLPYLLIKPA